MTEQNPFPNWPDFTPMFSASPKFSVPPYLELLHLNKESAPVFEVLKEILNQHEDLSEQIIALLSDMNWRLQIVGAISMALGRSISFRALAGI